MRTQSILAAMMMVMLAEWASGQAIGWRTDGVGAYPDAKPVYQWGPDRNVIWKTPMPDWSNASPVVAGDRVFVCAEPATLLCVALADGRILWHADHDYERVLPEDLRAQMRQQAQRDAADATARLADVEKQIEALKADQKPDKRRLRKLRRQRDQHKRAANAADPFKLPRTHGANGYSSPTPTSDGEHVFVLFGTGVLAAYDLQGDRRWVRFVGKPGHGWGLSASPLLAGGKLIVHHGKLRAFDPATGEPAWEVDSREHWGSPVATTIGQTPIVLTTDGQAVRAADGHVLATGLGQLEYAAPVVHDGVVYYIQGTSRAVKLPAAADEPFAPRPLWTTKIKGSRHYASPAVHDGLVFTISREENFSVLDAATGELLVEREDFLGGRGGSNSAYPSVTLAGDHVLVSNEKGVTAVVTADREAKVVATNNLEDFRATPVFVGDRMILRTRNHLYCFGASVE